jgi:creatinine amidohydrolase
VKTVTMEPKVAPEGSFTDAKNYAPASLMERIGSDPPRPPPDKGRDIVAAAKAALVQDAQRFSHRLMRH